MFRGQPRYTLPVAVKKYSESEQSTSPTDTKSTTK